MRIELGQKGDYAVRAVLDLARNGSKRTSRSVAAAMGIPEKYLPQLLGALVKAGVVTSTTGRSGGYTLARPSTGISLLEVVEAVEGPVERQRCILRGGPCHWDDECPLHATWSEMQGALVAKLASTSLADLAAADRKLVSRRSSRRRTTRASRPKGSPPHPRGPHRLPRSGGSLRREPVVSP